MKILVFGDTHLDLASFTQVVEKAREVDFIVCLGDISMFEEGLEEMLSYLGQLPKRVLLIHGNHERAEAMQEIAREHPNILFSHSQIVRVGEYDFITYGGDGFSRIDEVFEASKKIFVKEARKPQKTILILHGPPFETNLDVPFEGYHCGSISTRAFIDSFHPLAVFAGHIHETFHQRDRIGPTFLLNPGPDGEIIDLKELEKDYVETKKTKQAKKSKNKKS